MIRAALLAALFLASAGCTPSATPATGPFAEAVRRGMESGTERFDHAEWSRLLAASVSSGLVDYGRMKAERNLLDAYLARVAEAPLAKLSRPEVFALLANAYNALTVRAILDHPAIKGVKEIPDVWDKTTHRVGGFQVTLNTVEHAVLRPFYQDPRVHFALNCASRSCAALPPYALDGAQLDAQLDALRNAFLTDPKQVRVENGELAVSSYFKWFTGDFTNPEWKGAAKSIPAYVRPHATAVVRAFIDSKGGEPELEFLDYDWSLNAAGNAPAPAPGSPPHSSR